ncbi:MAG: hypothetical protein ACLSE8_15555 [Parasutterella sp.]
MARYRKIDVRMWNDRKFRELSDNAKLAFILLLTHPDTTQIGTIRTRVSNLADELGWQRDAMSHAIQEVTLNGMIDADERGRAHGHKQLPKVQRTFISERIQILA